MHVLTIDRYTGRMRGIRGDVLILVQAVLLPATCVITYFIATSQNHVEKEFPYISDTGTYSPESCVFGILLCFYTITTFICTYSRWKLVCSYIVDANLTPRLNNAALLFGSLAALGVLIVANFQETKVLWMHLIGAALAFIIGGFYMVLQTAVSYRVLALPGYSKWVCHLRLVLSVLTFCCSFLSGGLAMGAEGEKPANHTHTDTPGSGVWHSWMEGNDLHIASTSFEWAMAGLVSLFFLTFLREFSHLRVGLPVVHTALSKQDDGYRDNPGLDNPGYIGPDGSVDTAHKF